MKRITKIIETLVLPLPTILPWNKLYNTQHVAGISQIGLKSLPLGL